MVSMPSRRPPCSATVLLGLATLAAACGKGGGESSEPPATPPRPPPIDARSWKTIKLPKKVPRWNLKVPKRPPPAKPGPTLDLAALCKARHFAWLVVNRDGKRLHTVLGKRVTKLIPGAVAVGFGRHKGQQALPVSALFAPHPGVKAARLHSCGKPPRLITRESAGRWLLANNKKGQLKLLAVPGPGVAPSKPFRPVVLVELLDRH